MDQGESGETGSFSGVVEDVSVAGPVAGGRSAASEKEPEQSIWEAIPGHLRTLREIGEPVPEPGSVARKLEISQAA